MAQQLSSDSYLLASLIVWYVIKVTMGIRVTAEEEDAGMDLHDCGIEAYPEFKV